MSLLIPAHPWKPAGHRAATPHRRGYASGSPTLQRLTVDVALVASAHVWQKTSS